MLDAPPANVPAHAIVRLAGPLDVAASLEPFRRSGDDLLDRWDGTTLARTLPIAGGMVPYLVRPGGTREEPVFEALTEDAATLPLVAGALRASFMGDPARLASLVAADPIVARLHALYPGLRPVRQFDLLSAVVRCISAQQVNLRWAATLRRRLAEAYGCRHNVGGQDVWSLDAAPLAGASVADIQALQWTTRKAKYIVGVATAVAEGELDLRVLQTLPDDEVIACLTRLRGLGRWTAEWVLARTLGRPRVVAGDLAVRKAVGLAYLGNPSPSEEAVRAATVHWGAAAGMAQALVLHALAEGAIAPA